MHLRWNDDEILDFLVRRALKNNSLLSAYSQVSSNEKINVALALSILFPRVLEKMPFAEWFLFSTRDGRGRVSPRQVVLFLLLVTREAQEVSVSRSSIPVFSEQETAAAMDNLSELAFDEVRDDFRIARAFIANLRARKLDQFEECTVTNVFDEADGSKSEQLDLLERLGFVKRVARGEQTAFRVPRLFTRCWRTEVGDRHG